MDWFANLLDTLVVYAFCLCDDDEEEVKKIEEKEEEEYYDFDAFLFEEDYKNI